MSFDNIPKEMRPYGQWINWKYEDKQAFKPTKVPYSPFPDASGNMRLANVADWSTWGTFEQAIMSTASGHFDGIGFVFTKNDPFSGIDLDDAYELLENGNFKNQNPEEVRQRQLKIYQEFNSYTEFSPSGKGLHIIVKGIVPQGKRKASIELYSSGRFFTMTGNVTNNVPIAERTEMLQSLYHQMGGQIGQVLSYSDHSAPETEGDAAIIDKASNADNGAKFADLWGGPWQNHYSSQSEADFALINIIAFYTQNREQISRLFKTSHLGKRDKANRADYVGWMIDRSFDRMLPPVDIIGLAKGAELALANAHTILFDDDEAPQSKADEIPFESNDPYTVPPGLMGEIAQFIYASAPRPVKEMAIAAAIGAMAGVCGQAWNVSGVGLNLYVIMLAETGRGKEAMASGTDKLFQAVTANVPAAKDFRGPGQIQSGQALLKSLAASHGSYLALVGEFGIKMGQLTNARAGLAETALLQILLDMYNKSGQGRKILPTIYSDKANSLPEFEAPGFSILGESAPSSFYESVDERMIEGGLLPRFVMLEYDGIRVPMNKDRELVLPSFDLINNFGNLCAGALQLMTSAPKRAVNIRHDAESQKLLDEFDTYADAQINNSTNRVLTELWNRAHMNILKLSGLVAVGVNQYDPVTTAQHVLWARGIVVAGIKKIMQRFERGQIGHSSEEAKQVDEMSRIIKDYLTLPFERVKSYSNDESLHSAKIVSFAFISKRLMTNAAFKKDRQGASSAIKRTVQTMVDSGTIRELGKPDLAKYNSSQRGFMVVDMEILN